MNRELIEKTIRMWKDADYRDSLNAEERAKLHKSPVGTVELSRAELNALTGGGGGMTASANCWTDGVCS